MKMGLVKELGLSKEELLEHIQMLENRYEPFIQKENDKNKWMDDWDECIGEVRCGKLFITKETEDCETFSIPVEDLIGGRKDYDTPIEWLDKCIDGYCNTDRYNNGQSFILYK
jgi:hypothetical protein